MKRILLVIALFITLSTHAIERLLDVVYYDSRSGEPFVYSNTFDGLGYSDIEYNLPIASHMEINGMHIEFTIENEDFKWFIVRKYPDKTIDFIINLKTQGALIDTFGYHQTGYIPQQDQGIIRVNFD